MPRLAIVLLMLAVLFAGCAKLAGNGPKRAPMKWTGDALEGQGFTFYERRFPLVTVHYAPPTDPEQAEQMGQTAQEFLTYLSTEQRCCPSARIHLWLIPSSAAWPAGVRESPVTGFIRVMAPGQVVSRTFEVPPTPAGSRTTPGFGTLDAALTVAATQDAGSPAYSVDWLNRGMGAALAPVWSEFPGSVFRRTMKAQDIMSALETPNPTGDVGIASASLAALVIDRWGYDWTFHYPRKPEELTPQAMLLWGTGASDRATALKLFDDRMNFERTILQRRGNSGQNWFGTARMMSPERMAPKLGALPTGPGPMVNYSTHRYEIKARYDPAQASVSGEVKLTWQNGEGIPVDTLYFDLWPNAEAHAARGARLSVQSASVDGKPAAFKAQGLDLAVPLGRAVAQGEQVTVRVAFTTRIPGNTGYMLGKFSTDGFALGVWYPSLAVLDDRGWNLTPLAGSAGYSEHADYTVELDVPAGTVLAGTGRQVGRTDADGRWVYRYEAPRVLSWAAIGDQGLQEVTRQVGSVRLHVLGKDEAWRTKLVAEAAQVIQLLEKRYGAPPYTDITIVHGTYVNAPGLMGVQPGQDTDGFWHVQLSGLLAEQWFSSAIGCDRWGEPWLCIVPGNYASEVVGGSLSPTGFRRPTGNTPPPGLKVTSPMHEFDRLGDSTLLYSKGPQMLTDLERLVGSATMDRLLKEWAGRYRGKTANTSDFMALAEQVTGRDLKQFFADHLIDPTQRGPYRPALPLGKMTLP